MRVTFLLDRPWRWRDLIALLVTLALVAWMWRELQPEAQQARREEACRIAQDLRPYGPWEECIYPRQFPQPDC